MATEKRLIDANAIKYYEHIECGGHGIFIPTKTVTKEEIDNMPTVVPEIKLLSCYIENRIPKAKFVIDGREVEVTGYLVDFVEVIHGRWEKAEDFDFISGEYVTTGFNCDKCGCYYKKKSNYCPNCGADMRGDGNA